MDMGKEGLEKRCHLDLLKIKKRLIIPLHVRSVVDLTCVLSRPIPPPPTVGVARWSSRKNCSQKSLKMQFENSVSVKSAWRNSTNQEIWAKIILEVEFNLTVLVLAQRI
jgi:hypothetical protein